VAALVVAFVVVGPVAVLVVLDWQPVAAVDKSPWAVARRYLCPQDI